MVTRGLSRDKRLTAKEVAPILGTSPATVRRWAREGKIPHTRGPGGRYIFDRGEIISFLELRRVERVESKSGKQRVLLKGIPASPGVAEGKVKIVLQPAQAEKVNNGDILVAPFTTPQYTIAILRAAAIVTDIGSTLSHPAILSRELGIPCVVDTREGTRKLKDNMKVVVDGTEGTVLQKG